MEIVKNQFVNLFKISPWNNKILLIYLINYGNVDAVLREKVPVICVHMTLNLIN